MWNIYIFFKLPQRPQSTIYLFLVVQPDAWLRGIKSERMTGNSCTRPGTSTNRDAALLTRLDTNAVETSRRTAISPPPPRGKLNLQEHVCRTPRAAKRSCRCCLPHALKRPYLTRHATITCALLQKFESFRGCSAVHPHCVHGFYCCGNVFSHGLFFCTRRRLRR